MSWSEMDFHLTPDQQELVEEFRGGGHEQLARELELKGFTMYLERSYPDILEGLRGNTGVAPGQDNRKQTP